MKCIALKKNLYAFIFKSLSFDILDKLIIANMVINYNYFA